ncbi:MAG: hypothetical protein M3540_06665 [Actinomycetota bacterium]|nr:hypothetical protein [Actinomycetota bacterium]
MPEERSSVHAYVEAIDLSGIPRQPIPQDAAAEATEVFADAKTQAQVVGSTLFSFAQGVDADMRAAISDSALLAQLVANKHQNKDDAPIPWYDAYQEVLQNIGWVLQDSGWTDYSTRGAAAEVHQKLIEILTAALGAGTAALAIITSALNVLQKMTAGSSWLTIFSRETQHANIARFQVGLVQPGEADDVFVSLLACLIEAQRTITQVLVFKYRAEQASFRASNAKVSINRASLADLQPTIRVKVRAYQRDYVSSIKDL